MAHVGEELILRVILVPFAQPHFVEARAVAGYIRAQIRPGEQGRPAAIDFAFSQNERPCAALRRADRRAQAAAAASYDDHVIGDIHFRHFLSSIS